MSTELEKMLEDYAEAWSSHDVEKIAFYVTDDFIFEDTATGTSHDGKEELKSYLQRVFSSIPDFRLEVKSLFVAGDLVGAEWVETGTFTGRVFDTQVDGKNFSVRGASIGELRGGKIRRESIYWDRISYLRQLGLTLEAHSQ